MKTLIARLLDMLTYCRPAGSPTERAYIHRFIASLPGAWQDEYGNWRVDIGANPRVLFSSHTDTVHHDHGRQSVSYVNGVARVARKSRERLIRKPVSHFTGSNCLGADDTAGNFIMIAMIGARVPGHYIFHADEEIGCRGSSALANGYPGWLALEFDQAVAFDRRGCGDVIMRQFCGDCASVEYARALADQLNRGSVARGHHAFHYGPSVKGIVTDTAMYADLIPECVNLSVGYENEHTPAESLNVRHLLALADVLCRVEWDALPIVRDPDAVAVYDDPPMWASRTYIYDDDDLTIPAVVRKPHNGYLNADYAAAQHALSVFLKTR